MMTIEIGIDGQTIHRLFVHNVSPRSETEVCRYAVSLTRYGKRLAEVEHRRANGAVALAVKALQAIEKEVQRP